MHKFISTIPLFKQNCYFYIWFILIMLTIWTMFLFFINDNNNDSWNLDGIRYVHQIRQYQLINYYNQQALVSKYFYHWFTGNLLTAMSISTSRIWNYSLCPAACHSHVTLYGPSHCQGGHHNKEDLSTVVTEISNWKTCKLHDGTKFINYLYYSLIFL